jgi:AraC-like DNA-binding protein
LNEVGLGKEVLENPDAWMPQSQLCQFLELSLGRTGYDLLGLDAGIEKRRTHSEFSNLVLYSPTLFQTLVSICSNSDQEDTSAKFRVVREKDFFWMLCGNVLSTPGAVFQIETYRYAALLEIIRHAAGPQWLPSIVRFQSKTNKRILASPLLSNVNVKFESRELAIAISPKIMSLPMFDVPDLPMQISRFENIPREFPESVTEVVRTQILAQKPTIGATADALGMSTRTLQRRLSDQGLKFIRLVEYLRMNMAKNWLSESQMPVSQIADRLAYRHGSHFIRAFRKHTGLSPTQYRKVTETPVD